MFNAIMMKRKEATVDGRERDRFQRADLSSDDSEEEQEESSSEEDRGENVEEPQLLRPVDYQPASSFMRNGPNRMVDRVTSITLDPSLYPLSGDPPNVPIDGLPNDRVDAIVEFEKNVEERRRKLKENKSYQFASLVSGFMGNQDVSAILEPSVRYPSSSVREDDRTLRGKTYSNPIGEREKRAFEMFDDPMGNGVLAPSAAFLAALHGAYTDVSIMWDKTNLKKDKQNFRPLGFIPGQLKRMRETKKLPELQELIEGDENIQNQFARLVSRNMMESMNLARSGYNLQVNYVRVIRDKVDLTQSVVKLIMSKK